MSSETASYTAFEGHQLVVRGSLDIVVLKVKRRLDQAPSTKILIFSDQTGKEMDFNFQGTSTDVLKRLEPFLPVPESSGTASAGPGRPKLGVVSREVSLLPRHWEWLAAQPGGASASLRRLVEDAKKKSSAQNHVRQAQERAYKFMSVVAGNFEGYEEALRALYRKDRKSFLQNSKSWPGDVRNHALDLGQAVFASK